MKNIDKLAAKLEAHGVDLEKDAGWLGRLGATAVRGAQALGRGAQAVGRGAMSVVRAPGGFAGSVRSGFRASMTGAAERSMANAARGEMSNMTHQRIIGMQPSVATPSVPQGVPRAVAPAGDALARLKAFRAGAPAPAAAAPAPAPQAPAKGARRPRAAKQPAGAGWMSNAAMMAAPMLMGGGGGQQQQQQPVYNAMGTRIAEDEMKDLIEKVAAELPDASPEERLEAIAAIAMDLGFHEELAKAAGFKVETEKTAAVHKKIADRDVRFDKMTIQDLTGYLTEQYGRPAEVDEDEKTASAKSPAREKFASLLKAALARPT